MFFTHNLILWQQKWTYVVLATTKNKPILKNQLKKATLVNVLSIDTAGLLVHQLQKQL